MATVQASVTITLTPWQFRMANDFLPVKPKTGKLVISRIIDKIHWVTYKMPMEANPKSSWNLYLTDQQIARIQKTFDVKVNFSAINITEASMKEGKIAFR
jgi:hypothetical protein